MTLTVQNNRNREEIVKEDIDFLLSHFEGRQRLFPRKMSTFTTKGKQFTVHNKEQILDACIKANFLDCRLNAYPILEDELLQAPNFIFIDLDLPTKYENNLIELNKYQNETLKIIKQKLNGFEPTIIWSGNGYHIYIVLDIRPLEIIEELRELSNEPSEQLLRFFESTFTNNKKDSQHNPSFKSCLLRIPGTVNSKNDSDVKIIQKFNTDNIPSINNPLLREFRLYLADIDIRKRRMIKAYKSSDNSINIHYRSTESIQYEWIEKLLKTPIEEGRKYTLWKILCPYLVNIKKLENEDSFIILKTWLEKCNALKKLDFDTDTKIKDNLGNVKHYNPISLKNLKVDNKDLYLLLREKVMDLT
jgi:hypothetical protein